MRVYEFTALYHEIGHAARFLGFANDATRQYLWVQRDECSEAETASHAGNVWIERDDQQWGGYGGIAGVELSRDALFIRLTPDKAEQMGGFDLFRVHLALTDEEFTAVPDAVPEELLRVFFGYESLVRVPDNPNRSGAPLDSWGFRSWKLISPFACFNAG
jgi:hypothetical protein